MSKWDDALNTIKKLAAQHDEANSKMRQLYQSIMYHRELDKVGVNKEDVLDQIIGGGLHFPPGGPTSRAMARTHYIDWIFGVRVKGAPDERGQGPVVWFENPIPPQDKITHGLKSPKEREEQQRAKREYDRQAGFQRYGASEFGD